MTRVNIQNVTLTPIPSSSQCADFTNAQLFIEVLIEDKVAIQSDPALWSGSNMSWSINLNFDIPARTSCFSLCVIESTLQPYLQPDPTPIVFKIEDIVSNSQRRKRSNFRSATLTRSIGDTLRLDANFTVAVPQMFPLQENIIRSMVIAIFRDITLFNAYDVGVMHKSVQNFRFTNPRKLPLLNALGDIYMNQYAKYHSIEQLNNAIEAYGQASREVLWDEKIVYMTHYGNALLDRYQRIGTDSDLNNSLLILREASKPIPYYARPRKPTWEVKLGRLLFGGPKRHPESTYSMFEYTPDHLNALGNCLRVRYERFGDIEDLNESIVEFQKAIQCTPVNDPRLFNNLANCLLQRFKRTGETGDLNDSIIKFQEAERLIPDNDPDRPIALNGLGCAFQERFLRFGDVNDVNESVLKLEHAIRLTSNGHPDKLMWTSNLANGLRLRFHCLKDISDLNESIIKFQKVLPLIPDSHIAKSVMTNNLGISLFTRYERLGDLNDLNESVVQYHHAIRLYPDIHPDKPLCYNNLAQSLHARSQRISTIGDINASMVQLQEVLRLLPSDSPHKPFVLSALGNTIFRRFKRLGALSDLNESVVKYRDVMQLIPDGHPDEGVLCSNFACLLQERFSRLGNISDLQDAVIKCQKAEELTSDDNPQKWSILNNLGSLLYSRYKRFGDTCDLNDIVNKFKMALQLAPDHHPAKPLLLQNLGRSLLIQCQEQKPCNPAQAISEIAVIFSSAAAAEYGEPLVRLEAARQWARCHRILQRIHCVTTDILEPYRIAIPLLSEAAWLGSSLPDRHYQAIDFGCFIHEAATAACKMRQVTLAMEWLEQGRSVIWNQLLELRTPLQGLCEREQALSQRLKENSLQLEDDLAQQNMLAVSPLSEKWPRVAMERVHRLVAERKDILAAIRKQPGFERFLLPKQIDELMVAATNGPIVILTSSELDDMCFALILSPSLTSEVVPLRLESFSLSKARNLYSQLKQLLDISGRNSSLTKHSDVAAPPSATYRSFGSRETQELEESLRHLMIGYCGGGSETGSDEDDTRNVTNHKLATILAVLWHGVAKPILDALEITNASPESNIRLWWCPTGILSFLPLHAAGLYARGSAAGSRLSDFVIPSYTPTVSTLLDSKEPTPPSTQPRLLAIAQPSSDNQLYLPGTLKEIQCVEEAIQEALPMTSLVGKSATRENVISELKTSNWVHFACHGVQDLLHPTESALLLSGADRLSLADLAGIRVARGDFAFLSACQTAQGHENLSDEAVHLSAGMLVTGYRGVIATMWSVDDNVAPRVARDVYKHLVASGADASEAARALHLAVKKIIEANDSDDNASLMSWVPFIHLGR